jgi:hypothetical protein
MNITHLGDALSSGFVILGTKTPVGSVAAKQRRIPISHNVVPPLKGPAPAPEAISLWMRVRRLWTLSTTDEVFHEDGTSTRVTRVLRARKM